MTNNEMNFVNKLKKEYEKKGEDMTKLDELKALNKKVHTPARAFAYTLGTVAALILGTGMTMAMELIPGGMVTGIVIGSVGLLVSLLNYPLYKKVLGSRKNRHSKEIIELSNEILNEDK